MTRSKKAALTAAALITVVTSASADTLNWNGGISSVWQTGGAGWLNGATAGTWANGDSAIFGGTAPLSVSLTGAVSASGLSFTAPNYVLGGTGTLTLTGSISVASGTATIDAGLAGNALVKAGTGTLVFNNANKSFSGITINEGTVRVNGTATTGSTLPAEIFGASGSVVELNGGTLAMEFTAGLNTPSVNWPYRITVGPNGGTLQNFGAQNASGPAGNQVGGGQVNLNGGVVGNGTLTLDPGNSRFVLGGNTGNGGFSGKWILIGNNTTNGGRVAVGGDSSFGNAPSTFTPDAVTLQNKALLSGGGSGAGSVIGSANRGFTIGAGGGVFRTAGADATFTVAGPITGASGNNVTFQGDQGGTAASTLVVSNPGNNYSGNTILENTATGRHTVRLGASEVFPHGEGKGTVSFIAPGGTVDANNPRLVRLDLNGFNETINGFGTSAVQHVIDNISGPEGSTSTLTVGAADVSSAFSGKIQNSVAGRTVALTKIGAGVLTLEGTNTYSGPTTISSGTLALSAGATLTGTSRISVASGATFDVTAPGEFTLGAGQTLEGTGSVTGTILSAGTASSFSPGLSSAGTLTLETLDASLGANFKFELGTSADRIAIIDTFYGSLDAASLRFDFSAVTGFAAKTPYTLFTFDFADNLQIGDFLVNSLPAGYALDTTFGNGGWQITDSSVQVQFVPEPATATLLLGGLGFLFGRRRRPAHA